MLNQWNVKHLLSTKILTQILKTSEHIKIHVLSENSKETETGNRKRTEKKRYKKN